MRNLLVAALLASSALAQATLTWIAHPTNGREYALTGSGSWVAAESEAVAQGGHLATVRNATENSWLMQTFGPTRWIGLNDAAHEGQWIWASGEPTYFVNWEGGQPDGAGSENYACLHLGGTWHDDQTASYQGIVERYRAQPTWVLSPVNGHYYALTRNLSWSDAEQMAQSFGGHLATIRSGTENAWLASTFGSIVECLWIGLNDAASEGSFVWASGEPVTYTHWNLNEPNGGTIENWVHMSLPWGGIMDLTDWNDSPNSALVYGWPARGIMETVNLSPIATYAPHGAGCLDPNGLVPALAAVPGEVPRPGSTSHVRVTNLPLAVTIPVFVVGFSNTWDADGYPLPLDLGIIGWTGCSQFVADDILYWTITTTGQADQPIFVPPGTPLGFTFHVQALVLYTPTGVALSNAVTGLVGY